MSETLTGTELSRLSLNALVLRALRTKTADGYDLEFCGVHTYVIGPPSDYPVIVAINASVHCYDFSLNAIRISRLTYPTAESYRGGSGFCNEFMGRAWTPIATQWLEPEQRILLEKKEPDGDVEYSSFVNPPYLADLAMMVPFIGLKLERLIDEKQIIDHRVNATVRSFQTHLRAFIGRHLREFNDGIRRASEIIASLRQD